MVSIRERSGRKGAVMQGMRQEDLDVLSIDDLDMPVRAWNCLRRAECETVGQLVLMRPQQLLRLKNFGKQSLADVVRALGYLGLSLAPDDVQEDRRDWRRRMREMEEEYGG